MKNISKYVAFALTGLFMTACDGDYTNWAAPQQWGQEDAITIPGFTATGVSAIDLANETDSVKTFTLSTATLPEGFSLKNARVELTPVGTTGAKETITTAVSGLSSVSDLQTLVENVWGKRPTNRTYDAHVYANAMKNGQAVLIDAGTIQINVTPVAPIIDTKYYITGGINGWDNTNTTYEVTNSGADPYKDPVFTITIPADALNGASFEFKLTPLSGIGGDWSQCITASADGTTGKLTDKNAGGNLKVDYVEGAKIYRLTFNLLDQTWSQEALSFNEYIYEIGNDSGWGTPNPMRSPNFDGQYEAYINLNGEFKFKPNENDWNGDWGKGATEGSLVQEGESNIVGGVGVYKINVDLAAMTYSLTAVTSISMIGDFNSWGGDTDMTYNATEKCWEATTTFATTGGVKFRMNHDWSISWGGKASGDDFANLTSNNGNNLNVAAGTYKVKFYLNYEGKNSVTFEPVS